MDHPDTLREALRLYAAGLRPIPLKGKAPLLANWQTRILTSQEISYYWTQHPGANVGVVCGHDPADPEAFAIIVADVDPKNGGNAWADIHHEQLLKDGAAVVRTGGGGRHYYFKAPRGYIASGTHKIAPGVDLKADGGHQVVAPPSIHPNTGAAYVWETTHTAADAALLGVLPAWIATPTTGPERRTGKNRGETFGDLPADILTCQERMRSFAPAVEGQGGDAHTFRAACMGRDHDLSPLVFWPILEEWNDRCEPPWDPADLREKMDRAYLYAKDERGGKSVADLPLEPYEPGSDADPNTPRPRRRTGNPEAEAAIAARVAAEEAEDAALEWVHEIRKTKDGGWRDHTSSADIALRHDPRLARLFRRNLLTGEVELHGRVPWRTSPGPLTLTDRDLEGIATWVATAAYPGDMGGLLSEATWHRGINLAAERNQFHPVRDWLDGLTWDGVPRLDQAAVRYFGAPEPVAGVFLAKWMIAAIARARVPGPRAKMDACLVLEGLQGLGKTTAFQRLFGDSWYAELRGVDPEDKDTPMRLRGVWCAEFAEMGGFGKKEQALWKGFISATEDRQRDPYARTVTLWPRQCVLAATTNSTSYLVDETGNRRWWPILCRKADLDGITQDRAQLWAEANARWNSGQTWNDATCAWKLSAAEIVLATEAQAARHIGDVWDEAFARWVVGRDFFRFDDFWEGCLCRPRHAGRVEDTHHLSKVARMNGWTAVRRRVDGVQVKGYARLSEGETVGKTVDVHGTHFSSPCASTVLDTGSDVNDVVPLF